jgi:hypothetical protein
VFNGRQWLYGDAFHLLQVEGYGVAVAQVRLHAPVVGMKGNGVETVGGHGHVPHGRLAVEADTGLILSGGRQRGTAESRKQALAKRSFHSVAVVFHLTVQNKQKPAKRAETIIHGNRKKI